MSIRQKLTGFLMVVAIGSLSIPGASLEAADPEIAGCIHCNCLLSTSAIMNIMETDNIEKHSMYQFQESDQTGIGRTAGEFFLGGAGSILAGLGGGIIGYALTYDPNQSSWLNFSGFDGAVPGYLITSNFGCAAAVWSIGCIGDEQGSFGSALGGSALGTLVSVGIIALIKPEIDYSEIFFLSASQAIGAIIAFNHSQKKKTVDASGALLNLNNDRLVCAVPQVSLYPESSNSNCLKLQLFRAKF
ncbi:hypothetical protein JW906_16230 [bacterium]|nr:hypothetical protein [bacterium]